MASVPQKLIGIGAGVAVIVVALVALSSMAGSDERQIKKSIQKSAKTWNEKDYRTEYERMTSNYRNNVSYEQWKNYAKGLSSLGLLFLGPGKLEASNINV